MLPDMRTVLWNPIKNPMTSEWLQNPTADWWHGGWRLLGVECGFLALTRPHGLILGRQGLPLSLCPCMQDGLMCAAKPKPKTGPWHRSSSTFVKEQGGTICVREWKTLCDSFIPLVLGILLALAYKSTGVGAAFEVKHQKAQKGVAELHKAEHASQSPTVYFTLYLFC